MDVFRPEVQAALEKAEGRYQVERMRSHFHVLFERIIAIREHPNCPEKQSIMDETERSLGMEEQAGRITLHQRLSLLQLLWDGRKELYIDGQS